MASSPETDMEIDKEQDKHPKLESRFRSIPLQALRPSARRQIALQMDIPQDLIHEEIGMLTDWRGLAELVGFSYLEMQKLERSKSPTQELLSDWELNPDYHPTIGNFWAHMMFLKRQDVLMECKNLIERDAQSFIQSKERLANDYYPVQEDIISSTSSSVTNMDHYVNETVIVTKDDVGNTGPQVIYDAFVCYNDNSENDGQFVNQTIKHLEHDRGLRLFIPNRDSLAGGAKYVIDAELIKSRCKRMVIVISRDFIHSQACDFQVKFAHSLAPGARKKRLIPVLMEERLPIPDILRHVTICDYTKTDLMEWFWDRLASSIKAPLDPDQEFDIKRQENEEVTRLPLKRVKQTPSFPSSNSNRSSDSSNSSSSSYSIVSAESLPPDYKCNSSNSTRERSDHHKNDMYVSFENIFPHKKEPVSKPKKILEFLQSKLSKSK